VPFFRLGDLDRTVVLPLSPSPSLSLSLSLSLFCFTHTRTYAAHCASSHVGSLHSRLTLPKQSVVAYLPVLISVCESRGCKTETRRLTSREGAPLVSLPLVFAMNSRERQRERVLKVRAQGPIKTKQAETGAALYFYFRDALLATVLNVTVESPKNETRRLARP